MKYVLVLSFSASVQAFAHRHVDRPFILVVGWWHVRFFLCYTIDTFLKFETIVLVFDRSVNSQVFGTRKKFFLLFRDLSDFFKYLSNKQEMLNLDLNLMVFSTVKSKVNRAAALRVTEIALKIYKYCDILMAYH